MANAREILDRMKSIQDTMKITNAMYMIYSSKLKKAKASLDETEPYFYSMQMAIGRILRHVPDMKSEFFNQRPEIKPEDRKVGYIVVTADKGLAGSYNHNIFKDVEECLKNNSHAKLFVVHTPFEDRRFPCIPCAFVALQRLKCTFAFNAIQPFFSGNDARRHHAIFHNAGTMALLGQT